MTDTNPQFIQLLEDYDAWKKRTGSPDYSPAAFMDWYHTEAVIEAVVKVAGGEGLPHDIRSLIPTPTQHWLLARYEETGQGIE